MHCLPPRSYGGRVMDVTQLTSRLFTGAALHAGDTSSLHGLGITHIIDCRIEGGKDLADLGATFHLLWNGTADDGAAKPASWFDKSLMFAMGALSHHRTKVLAHCAAGINRGPSTAYTILRACGYEPVPADSLIRLARPQVRIRYEADGETAVRSLGWV
jgi:hypothetical protein